MKGTTMTITPERAQAEFGAAVATISASYQCASGSLPKEDFTAVVSSVATELWPDEPFNLVLPLAWVALRIAQLYADATGRPITEVLAEIGADAATLGNP
jgi:hypothetical protein